MKRIFVALISSCAMCVVGMPASAAGISGDFIVGQWTDPIFSGCAVDALTRTTFEGPNSLCSDNSGSAVYGITNAATDSGPLAQSTINEGSAPQSSVIKFTGGSIPASHATVPFVIGGISFTNGTSVNTSLLYGATLDLYASNGFTTVFIGSEVVSFTTTVNDGDATQNADYLNFSGLAGVSFEAFEGATATGSLNGLVIGDPQTVLTSITLDANQDANGFIGTDSPARVPEPITFSIFGAGLAGLGVLQRRQAKRRPRS